VIERSEIAVAKRRVVSLSVVTSPTVIGVLVKIHLIISEGN
jgi:hypothetical protein